MAGRVCWRGTGFQPREAARGVLARGVRAVKRVCVIGAGIAGLALAIRLAAAGIATVLVERSATPGAAAGAWSVADQPPNPGHDAPAHDALPLVIDDRAALDELWECAGEAPLPDSALMPIDPLWRMIWPDGATLDCPADGAARRAAVARFAPGDLAGHEDFARFAEETWREGLRGIGAAPVPDMATMLRGIPAQLRMQAWRSLRAVIAGDVKSPRLREALALRVLAIGGNPVTAPASTAFLHKLDRDGGLWWPRGGGAGLAAAMLALFTRLGGSARLGDAAVAVHTIGTRATEVETASGWRERFDAVASGEDVMHTYRDLLADNPRGPAMAAKLARMRWSPAAFVLHFSAEGRWPAIAHHTLMLSSRFAGLFDDIFEHGVLPRDMVIHLHHPAATDPGCDPPGITRFSAVVPVANLGKLPLDWQGLAPLMTRRVLGEVALRLIPDIRDRLITTTAITPSDFEQAFARHLGAAHGLEPTRGQSGWLRPHNRDPVIGNVYLVGPSTHPGPGFAQEMAGAKLTAGLIVGGVWI